jgi:hypothetical protein
VKNLDLELAKGVSHLVMEGGELLYKYVPSIG